MYGYYIPRPSRSLIVIILACLVKGAVKLPAPHVLHKLPIMALCGIFPEDVVILLSSIKGTVRI